MIDKTFFISLYGSQITYLNFKLVNWHKKITIYIEKDRFEESSLNSLFEALFHHINQYTCLNFHISTLPTNICFLNLLLPKVEMYKINDISISWENLKQFNFNDKVTALKTLNLYLHNPNEYEIFKLIDILTPITFVNIRCYKNGLLNHLGYFKTSNLMDDLQFKMIKELSNRNIPYKSYYNQY